MKILLCGSEGQLGHELAGPLASFATLAAPPERAFDITDASVVAATLGAERPDVVVNASAYTDVDGAERDPALAERVNRDAVRSLGLACQERGIGLVHVSTDFVFDGEAHRPYVETDPCRPINAYGRSKREGELALVETGAPAIVLRTAWVYSLRRKSFVSAILKAAREREELKIVADQVGSPTFCRDLAVAIALLLRGLGARAPQALADAAGIYHLAGGGEPASRIELARAALELDPHKDAQRVKTLVPIETSALPAPAARPLRTPLDSSACWARFGVRLPDWRDALRRALAPSVV
ncbi:MAG: dTDP-4-dehydrorhamnose reductase [Polyangiaceae bacterium]|nr:dTDP-4-dehydrorhamnose reductase [Polyangiaceae bacterium]